MSEQRDKMFALALDKYAALVVAREAIGAKYGYDSPLFYDAEQDVLHHHANLLAVVQAWQDLAAREPKRDCCPCDPDCRCQACDQAAAEDAMHRAECRADDERFAREREGK